MTTPAPQPPAARYNYFKLLWLIVLVPLWSAQYIAVVPTVWVWKVIVVPAFKVGGLLVLLVFIPFFGWLIILLVLLARRPAVVMVQNADGSYQPVASGKVRGRYLRPWGKSLLV